MDQGVAAATNTALAEERANKLTISTAPSMGAACAAVLADGASAYGEWKESAMWRQTGNVGHLEVARYTLPMPGESTGEFWSVCIPQLGVWVATLDDRATALARLDVLILDAEKVCRIIESGIIPGSPPSQPLGGHPAPGS
jgi:hypothetical protein